MKIRRTSYHTTWLADLSIGVELDSEYQCECLRAEGDSPQAAFDRLAARAALFTWPKGQFLDWTLTIEMRRFDMEDDIAPSARRHGLEPLAAETRVWRSQMFTGRPTDHVLMSEFASIIKQARIKPGKPISK